MKGNKHISSGIEIVNETRSLARVRMLSPFSAPDIRASEKLVERLKDPSFVASQWSIVPAQQKQDNFNFSKVGDILPREEDYISVNFRALSKTIVEGHWIDWSKDNVLKDSMPLLLGATVYPNHDFSDINNWLGSVRNVVWDEQGSQAEGVPGINAEYKIDALMNPRIARGLLMQPPAIHSTSMTVLFKYEFSHPDIATENRWRFYELLGEEVEGSIVRFIATQILEYWEASLVFQGADRLAKQYDESDDHDFADMSKRTDDNPPAAGNALPPNSNEEKTMKLTAEQKKELGIEFDGEDVPETEILKAAESHAAKAKEFDGVNIAELQKKAAAADGYIEKQRAEVSRLAKLAELGAEQGDLEEVIAQQIGGADFDTLVKLEAYFAKRVGEKFPTLSKSSQEDSKVIENAGGISTEEMTVPEVGLL
jgi:hypothetical protein